VRTAKRNFVLEVLAYRLVFWAFCAERYEQTRRNLSCSVLSAYLTHVQPGCCCLWAVYLALKDCALRVASALASLPFRHTLLHKTFRKWLKIKCHWTYLRWFTFIYNGNHKHHSYTRQHFAKPSFISLPCYLDVLRPVIQNHKLL
jgi:hypothetical protein